MDPSWLLTTCRGSQQREDQGDFPRVQPDPDPVPVNGEFPDDLRNDLEFRRLFILPDQPLQFPGHEGRRQREIADPAGTRPVGEGY